MLSFRRILRSLIIILILLLTNSYSWALLPVQKCLICHGKRDFKKTYPDGKVKPLYADPLIIEKSVHSKKTCTDCHFDAVEIPHSKTPERVQCIRCHYKGNPEGAPQSDAYLEYRESIHGRAVIAGNAAAPVCQDCHGTHDILHTKNPLSRVSHGRVAETCGRCHMNIFAQYRSSIHGVALYERKIPEAPDCTSCHGEHGIRSPKDPTSPVYPTKVTKTCSSCHEEEGIVGKYGIKTEQVETYKESFHGIAIRYGARTVANCASCHGVHDIRPPEDPLSSVYIKNIPQTCGKCHPGANINYARGKIHVNPKKKEAGIIYWVSLFFKYFTFTVILSLIAHIFLDLYRRVQELREKRT